MASCEHENQHELNTSVVYATVSPRYVIEFPYECFHTHAPVCTAHWCSLTSLLNPVTNPLCPQHALVPNATNQVVPNRMFTGLSYPDKLEAYMHRTTAPGGPTLAQDLRGSWSLQFDPFKKVATVRSMVWPGYTFFYNAHEMVWGALYYGDGVRNDDLIFML